MFHKHSPLSKNGYLILEIYPFVVTKVVTSCKKSGHLFFEDKLLYKRLLNPFYYDNKSQYLIF